ncbi:Zinc finger C2H2 type [Paragonimus kellicotti]|nr:Zinc finger C2H2 type [Paragonimus kellicotti]
MLGLVLIYPLDFIVITTRHPRLVKTRASTGSLTSSVDDVRSNVSDATTMPAHSDNNSFTSNTANRDLTCTWCHRSDFASFRLLSSHRTKCAARQKSFTRSHSTRLGHMQTRNKLSLSIRLWPCPSCGLKFRSNPVLRAHMAGNCSQALKHRRQQLLQADGKMYCPGCSKTSQPFESVDDVLAHLLSLKPNVGHAHASHGQLSRAHCWPSYLAVPNLGFGCPICGLLLASESRLDKHKRAVHELWLRVEHQKALSPKKKTMLLFVISAFELSVLLYCSSPWQA